MNLRDATKQYQFLCLWLLLPSHPILRDVINFACVYWKHISTYEAKGASGNLIFPLYSLFMRRWYWANIITREWCRSDSSYLHCKTLLTHGLSLPVWSKLYVSCVAPDLHVPTFHLEQQQITRCVKVLMWKRVEAERGNCKPKGTPEVYLQRQYQCIS